jgi:hypothetical protein
MFKARVFARKVWRVIAATLRARMPAHTAGCFCFAIQRRVLFLAGGLVVSPLQKSTICFMASAWVAAI